MSKRTSSRLKNRISSSTEESLSAEEVDRIVKDSTESPTKFVEIFKGIGSRSVERFLDSLSPEGSDEVWNSWKSYIQEESPTSVIQCLINVGKSIEKGCPRSASLDFVRRLNSICLNRNSSVNDNLKNGTSFVCERLSLHFLGEFPFLSRILYYLLSKNLVGVYSPNLSRRMFSLLYGKNILNSCIEEPLKVLIFQNIKIRGFYESAEGVKVIALIVIELGKEYALKIHEAVKRFLPGNSKKNALRIGELYKRIWLNTKGELRKNFEELCIQDIMYHGVLANRSLAKDCEILPQIISLLEPFHEDKGAKALQGAICDLWEPILWRHLNVANALARCNAAEFLFRAFPLENPSKNLEERAIQREFQIKVMKDLLKDTDSGVRLIATRGVCRVLSLFWAMLSGESINSFLQIIFKDLCRDSESAQIRAAVVKGLSLILSNHDSHVCLKKVLPNVRNSLRDVNDNVRLSVVELLSAVKTVKSIMFWEICPLEDLLFRLSVDKSPAVCREIVRLIFNSFFPTDQSESIKLERCVYLIEQDSDAARRFYEYSSRYMNLLDAVKFMLTILAVFKKHIKVVASEIQNFSSQQEEEANSSGKENLSNRVNKANESVPTALNLEEEPSLSNEADSFISDSKVMEHLLEILTVMWISRYKELIDEKQAVYRAIIEKKTTKIMTNLFKLYKGTDMCEKIIYFCSLFCHASVNVILKHCFSALKKLKLEKKVNHKDFVISSWRGKLFHGETEQFSTFIDALCNWGRGKDLLEFVLCGIKESFDRFSISSGAGSPRPKRRKTVQFSMGESKQVGQDSLTLLTYSLRHSINKEHLLSKNKEKLNEIRMELSRVLPIIELELSSPSVNQDVEALTEHLYLLWEAYLKTVLLLENEKSAIAKLIESAISIFDAESDSTLRVPFVKSFVLFISNTFSLGKIGQGSMGIKCLHFSLANLKKTKQIEDAYLFFSLLGEILDWSIVKDKDRAIDEGILSALLIESLKYMNPGEISSSVSYDIKLVLTSVLETFRRIPYENDFYYDLVKSFIGLALKDILQHHEHPGVNLKESYVSLQDLPILSSIIVNIFNLNRTLLDDFFEELKISIQLNVLSEKELQGTVVLLKTFCFDEKSKASVVSLKNCINEIDDFNQESLSETVKAMKIKLGLLM